MRLESTEVRSEEWATLAVRLVDLQIQDLLPTVQVAMPILEDRLQQAEQQISNHRVHHPQLQEHRAETCTTCT